MFFKVLTSCFEDVSLESSITEVLKMTMKKFALTKHFKIEKLEKLNETGLLDIVSNRTVSNTLEFCSNLMMSAKNNYISILEKEAVHRINGTGIAYKEAFKMLGVSNEHLMEYLVAKYTKDEKMSKKLWSQFRDSIMSKLEATTNLTVTGKLKELVEMRFSLPSKFFENELQMILGFDSFVTSILSGTIKLLPGYVNDTTSVKDLILAAIPVESKMDRFFNLTVAVAASRAGIQWQTVDRIKNKESIISLVSKLLGVPDNIEIVSKWLLKRGFSIKTVFFSKFPFINHDKKKELLPLQFLSIRLIDFYELYDFSTSVARVLPEKLIEIGKQSFPKNLPKIFNTIPVAMVKAKFLEEDFNVEKFYNILTEFFGDMKLQEKIMMKQVVYYYLTTYTGKFLQSEFNATTLGELREKIVGTKGKACKS